MFLEVGEDSMNRFIVLMNYLIYVKYIFCLSVIFEECLGLNFNDEVLVIGINVENEKISKIVIYSETFVFSFFIFRKSWCLFVNGKYLV